MLPDPKLLSLKRIRKIFGRHYGAAAELARELGVHRQNIYDTLNGRGRSARVEDAVRRRAVELLISESHRKPEPKRGKTQE